MPGTKDINRCSLVLMKTILLSFFIFIATNCWSQTITGEVIDTDTRKPLQHADVFLLQPDKTNDTINTYYCRYGKYRIIKQAKTDSLGRYTFHVATTQIYTIAASFIWRSERGDVQRLDIDSNMIVKAGTIRYRNLLVTCPFDKTKGQSFCPMCKQEDKVLPVLSGHPMYDEKGNFNGGKPFYLASCGEYPGCCPTRYCSRCDKEF